MSYMQWALQNLEALKRNKYPGRVTAAGLSESGNCLIRVVAVTARSPKSQNRQYVEVENNGVATRLADPQKPSGDPEKTIYSAMIEQRGHLTMLVASNGRQSEDILRSMQDHRETMTALMGWSYEDDSICTPRISAAIALSNKGYTASMSILRRSQFGKSCVRNFFRYEEFEPGIGHMLTTYASDGNPPPHFYGEPIPIPLIGVDAEAIANGIWEILDEGNRVCLAVITTEIATGKSGKPFIINKY